MQKCEFYKLINFLFGKEARRVKFLLGRDVWAGIGGLGARFGLELGG